MRGPIKVYRGAKNYRDVGKLVSLKGETKLRVWKRDECNEFRGTDGTKYAPISPPKTDFWSFSLEFCRSIKMYFVQRENYFGIPVRYMKNFVLFFT